MMKSKKIEIVDITEDDDTVIKKDDVETVEEIKPISAGIKEEASEQPVVN